MVRRKYRHGFLRGLSSLVPGSSGELAVPRGSEMYQKDPASKEAFKRRPSLSDPAWLEKVHDRLIESVKRNAPYRPIFYNLADESGIADLAAFWDYDFSDQSLEAMRRWLRERYSTLDDLNRQWGTTFTS